MQHATQVLDEADALTHMAQSALRRVVEDWEACTRFVFICNDVDKIAPPLRSRCMPVFVPALSMDALTAIVGGRVSTDILVHARGDARAALKALRLQEAGVGAAQICAALGAPPALNPSFLAQPSTKRAKLLATILDDGIPADTAVRAILRTAPPSDHAVCLASRTLHMLNQGGDPDLVLQWFCTMLVLHAK